MAYCTQCGKSLLPVAKFCPACGTQVITIQSKTYASGYKEKMFKGVEQQLKSSLRSKATSSFQKNASEWIEKSKTGAKKAQEVTSKTKVTEVAKQETTGGVTIWTWLYLIVNTILAVRSYRLNEVLGILFFSFLVLVLVFIRLKKPKPYNWLIKLLVVVQVVFLAALIYLSVMDQNFTFTSLLFAALLFIDFKLLFNGNKN